MGGNVDFLMISTQHPAHPGKTRYLQLPLPHPGPDYRGLETPLREIYATFIGTPVSAIVDSIVHLSTRKPPTHNLAARALLVEPETERTQTQLWNISQ